MADVTLTLPVAAGATVGTLGATLSDHSLFTGTFDAQPGGADGSSFTVSGDTVTTTIALATPRPYTFTCTAREAGISNSPFTQQFTVNVTAGPGIGPPASSPFLTADFTSAMNYVSPGSGQQIISPRMWGVSTGAAGNAGFYPFTFDTWTSAIATINPGLWYFVGNLAGGTFPSNAPASPWFNGDLSVNTTTMGHLINNFYKVDPRGVSGIVLGLDFAGTGAAVVSTQADWNTCMTNLARYFYNNGNGRLMPNNKPCPVIGFAGHNEPGNQTQTQSYYQGLVSLVHGVNPNYVVVGPVAADFGVINITQFMQNVAGMDVIGWDAFITNNSNLGNQVWQNSSYINWYAGTIPDNNPSGWPYQPKAITMFGNIDTGCSDPAMENGNGALWGMLQLITSQNLSPAPFWSGWWDAYDDGTCGIVDGQIIPDGNYRISPLGYAMAQGIRHVTGKRWNVPTNAGGLYTMATTPSPGHFGLLAVNTGAAQNSKTVALSHVPTGFGIDSSGNGAATVWQINSSASLGQDGTSSQINVSSGVTAPMNFPPGSITFISV